MATQTPVPSRAAIHALRGLLFTTSCSVAFLAEERRRRLKTVKAAAENARKIHAAKVLRGAPVVDGLQPWEARLRERALETHESNSTWDSALSPREVQRGIRRKKKRSTRKENQHVNVSDAGKTAAPLPTVHDRGFRRLAVRPCLSTSTEQVARLKPAHRTFSTRHSDPGGQASSETRYASPKDQRNSTRSAASKQSPYNSRRNTADLYTRNLPRRSIYTSSQRSSEALAASFQNMDLHAETVKKPSRWREEMPSQETGAPQQAYRPSLVEQPVETRRPVGVKSSETTNPTDRPEGRAAVSRFHNNVVQLMDFAENTQPVYQEEAKSALRRLVFEDGSTKKLEGLEPEFIMSLASTLLNPKWVATGPPGAIILLNAWEAQHKASDAAQDAQLSELCIVREVREGNWTALLNIDSLDYFVELAPTLLRMIPPRNGDPYLVSVLDRLIDEGKYSPEARDYALIELMAIREAHMGKWDTVLPALARAVEARQTATHKGVKSDDDANAGLASRAATIAELFVESQPAAQHATFLCELYTIQPFQLSPRLMEPALNHFGEQRLLAEYLQWLDFGVSTDAHIDRKFAHTLHQSLQHHWNASHTVVMKHLRPQLNKVMVREPRVDYCSPNKREDAKAIGMAQFTAAQRRDWDTVVEAYFLGQKKGQPFRLGWLRWAVTALMKLDGPQCVAADNLIIEARNEGHDVSSLEEWLPTYRMKQGWIGVSLFENTKQNGFHLSQPVYNSAIRELIEQKEYTQAWKLVCEDAEKHGNGRLAHDEYSLSNTLSILFGFDRVRMFTEIKGVLENFISTRAGWHRTNICRTRLLYFHGLLANSREMQNQGLNVDDVGAERYAQLLELKDLFSKAYDHVKEMRGLADGFDGPGKIVAEVSTILKREDLYHEPTAETPRRRPWFAKSFQEVHIPVPEEKTTLDEEDWSRQTSEKEARKQRVKVLPAEDVASPSVEHLMRQQRLSSHERVTTQVQVESEAQPASVSQSSRFYAESGQHQRLVATA